MKIRCILPIVLLSFCLLHAQSDSSNTGTSNDKLRGMRSRISQEIENQIIDSAHTENKYPLTDSIKSFFREKNNFAIGYLFNLDKNCNFAGHGVAVKMIGQRLGFSISFAQYKPEEEAPEFPAEMSSKYLVLLPFQESGKIEMLLPVNKQTTLDFNFLLTLLKNNRDSFFLTVGFGGDYTTQKRISRDYNVSSYYNGSNYDYIFSYTGEETAVTEKDFDRFVTIGLGIDYNLTDNVQLSGVVKLKGKEGTIANYTPLTHLALSYLL